MRKTTQQRKRGERGFTLIELLVVVVIGGILAAMTIPSIANQRRSAAFTQTRQSLESAVDVVNSYMASTYGKVPNLRLECAQDSDTCTFPCNSDLGTCGTGTTTSWNASTDKDSVKKTNYAPVNTFDKSNDVAIVYEPCYFSHSSECAVGTDVYNLSTVSGFVVYATNPKMDSTSADFLMYKSMTGKYYSGHGTPGTDERDLKEL